MVLSGSKVDGAERKEKFSSCRSLTQEPSEHPTATTSRPNRVSLWGASWFGSRSLQSHLFHVLLSVSSKDCLPLGSLPDCLRPWSPNLIGKHVLIEMLALVIVVTSNGMVLITNVSSYLTHYALPWIAGGFLYLWWTVISSNKGTQGASSTDLLNIHQGAWRDSAVS